MELLCGSRQTLDLSRSLRGLWRACLVSIFFCVGRYVSCFRGTCVTSSAFITAAFKLGGESLSYAEDSLLILGPQRQLWT